MERGLLPVGTLLLSAALVVLPAGPAGAAVLEVCPSGCSFAGIQAAIDASSDGDTILVHDGRYVETVNYKNKAVTVRSVNGPGSTVIDGGLGFAPVVTFDSYEGPGSLLDGFTVTGGRATSGAGIKIQNASPVVVNCVVADNRATYGGGFHISGSSAAPVIRDTVITGNDATDRGSGMYTEAAGVVTLERCTVSGNTTNSALYFLYGEGGSVTGCDVLSNAGGIRANGNTVTVSRSKVLGNDGTGVYVLYPDGFLLADSLVAGNRGSGVGIYYFGSATILRSVIAGNNGTIGGGIHIFQSDLSVESSLIIGNRADEGGGIYNNSGTLSLDGVTVAGNYASYGGGISAFDAVVVNSIVWGNIAGTSDPQIDTQGGSPNVFVTWSDVQGGWAGEGNINQDPLFVSPAVAVTPFTAGDYRLQAGSPCIDAGSGSPSAGLDFQGDPAPQGAGRDMGADEFAPLANGSFEAAAEKIPAPWKGSGLGRKDGRVTIQARSGGSSFLVTGGPVAKKLRQNVSLAGSAGDVLTLGAWSRAASVPAAGSTVAVVAKVFHADGTAKTYRAALGKGTHDWEEASKSFTALKDYTRVLVTLLYSAPKGKVWFDDVSLAVQPGP